MLGAEVTWLLTGLYVAQFNGVGLFPQAVPEIASSVRTHQRNHIRWISEVSIPQ